MQTNKLLLIMNLENTDKILYGVCSCNIIGTYCNMDIFVVASVHDRAYCFSVKQYTYNLWITTLFHKYYHVIICINIFLICHMSVFQNVCASCCKHVLIHQFILIIMHIVDGMVPFMPHVY